MSHTVVGVYDTYQQARDAFNDLLVCGFARSDVQLIPAQERTAGGSEPDEAAEKDLGPELGIGNFFRSLFGLDERDRHAAVYSEALRRGSYMVTVTACGDEQCGQAMEIMDRHAPVDIDERTSQWQQQGWAGYDAAAPIRADTEVEQPGNLYRGGRSDEAESDRAIRRGGVRVFSQPADAEVVRRAAGSPDDQSFTDQLVAAQSETGTVADDSDDADFRRHWEMAYARAGGSYEDYVPAYRYGSELAKDERYRGYRWGDVEPQARLDWESNNAGTPWERTKDAIRFGWETLIR